MNVWERWLVPNPDGKSWDLLQIYFKEYYGPTWLFAVDLGTGVVKKQRLPDGHQFYLSGPALGFDGKYARLPQEHGVEYWLYHGEAIPKLNNQPPWPKQDSPWDKAVPKPEVYFDQIDPGSRVRTWGFADFRLDR